jgi:hypothetical protein
MTSVPAWTFEHSVQCNASRNFAWSYWTNIENWNDPPAKFELNGPFAVGSRLTTTMPDQTLYSVIRSVEPECAATIEMQLPDGVISFHWTFEDLSGTRSRITQRLVLSTASEGLVAQASVLEQTVPQGMNKLTAAIEGASDRKTSFAGEVYEARCLDVHIRNGGDASGVTDTREEDIF